MHSKYVLHYTGHLMLNDVKLRDVGKGNNTSTQ